MYELKKIGIVKRASAWLLDAILLAVLATGIIWVISLICRFEAQSALLTQYNQQLNDFQEAHGKAVAEHYGYTYSVDEDGVLTVTKGGREASFDDVIRELVNSEGKDEAVKAAYDAYLNLPINEFVAQYRLVSNLLFMMVTLGLLIAYMVLEFLVPLLMKNGQTVGKKIFGIGLVRPDCVKMPAFALFARTLIGKFAIETMFPILLVFMFIFGGLGLLAVILIAALFILQIVLLFATKNKTVIHDLLASTVAVDIKLQMIYETVEAREEELRRIHKEEAERPEEQGAHAAQEGQNGEVREQEGHEAQE